jgi:hypothetical protein
MIPKPRWLAAGFFISERSTSSTEARGRWSLSVQSARAWSQRMSQCKATGTNILDKEDHFTMQTQRK